MGRVGGKRGFTPLKTIEKSKRIMMSLTGFTLLEVIISALLIMVGLGALGITVVAAKRFLKLSENRSQAMSLAMTAMERCLAKSYDTVEDDVPEDDIIDDGFNWTATVTPGEESGVSTIPYKKIDVVVSYQEAGEDNTLETKKVCLSNIIPYPAVHTASVKLGPDLTTEMPESYAKIPGLAIDIDYEVTKDIMVMYNVAVNVQDDKTNKLISSDTIYTACYLDDDDDQEGIETRTPILTQPSFNNVVVLKSVPKIDPGEHTIDVRWYKRVKESGAGNITLKEANLIIVATESKS